MYYIYYNISFRNNFIDRLMRLYESGIESYKSNELVSHKLFSDYMKNININVNNRVEFNEYDPRDLNRFDLSNQHLLICYFILLIGHVFSIIIVIFEKLMFYGL